MAKVTTTAPLARATNGAAGRRVISGPPSAARQTSSPMSSAKAAR